MCTMNLKDFFQSTIAFIENAEKETEREKNLNNVVSSTRSKTIYYKEIFGCGL